MPSPLQLYQSDIERKDYIQDDAQTQGLMALDNLYHDIMQAKADSQSSIYLWGRVGRGKTYVMDCFYKALNGQAQRLHYYRFMQYIHQQLTFYQGKSDPLSYVAQDLMKTQKILCLDEFFVSDIADAMILGRLLTVLFEKGLILVTTSNVAPTQLYQEGLQRDRFLPAIAMLEKHFNIIEMQGSEDHRLSKAQGFPHYIQIDNYLAVDDNPVFKRFIKDVAKEPIERDVKLTIEGRQISCLARTKKIYCFDFEKLFIGPRSANDYIALSSMMEKVYLLNVPQMGGALNERKVARGTEDTYNINQRVANRPFVLAKGDDEARRFISFIDEMYDQGKQVVISAAKPLAELYLGGRVVFEFERTTSRIIEMQGTEYTARV